MSRYTLKLSKSAKKLLDKNDKNTRRRIIEVLHGLTEEPYSYKGSVKLMGYENIYRARVGKYRIIYEIFNHKLIIFIQDIDSRGEVYKNL